MKKTLLYIIVLLFYGLSPSEAQVPPQKKGTMKVRKTKSEQPNPNKVRKTFKPTQRFDL